MAVADYALTTLANAKSILRVTSTADDAKLELYINAYSRAIRHYTGREFAPKTPANDVDAAVERILQWDGKGGLTLEPYEARSITTVKLYVGNAAGQTIAVDDWRAEPRAKSDEGTYLWLAMRDVTNLEGSAFPKPQLATYGVGVTGRWGAGDKAGEAASKVPPDVEMACVIAVANAYRNPEGFAQRSVGEMDVYESAEPDTDDGLALPRDARYLLIPYRRQRARMKARAGITA